MASQNHYRPFSFFMKGNGPLFQPIDDPMVSNRLLSMSAIVWIVSKFGGAMMGGKQFLLESE